MQEQREAVQRMQDYIAEHLNEKIKPEELAEVSMFSKWYADKLFQKFTGYTTAAYIRRLKLSKSALRLRNENTKIIDVAYDMGFESVDGYQRSFRREFGCNPHEYATRIIPSFYFAPIGVMKNQDCNQQRIVDKENVKMENANYVFIQVIEKPARKAIIKRGKTATEYFKYCEEVGCDIWDKLVSMKSLCNEPVCMWLPQNLIKPGTSKYVQGVEVEKDYKGEVPEGFDIIDLPTCKYLMFQGEPFAEEDYEKAIGAIWGAIDKYNPEAIGYSFDQENPRIQLAPIGKRGYIELVPIK